MTVQQKIDAKYEKKRRVLLQYVRAKRELYRIVTREVLKDNARTAKN